MSKQKVKLKNALAGALANNSPAVASASAAVTAELQKINTASLDDAQRQQYQQITQSQSSVISTANAAVAANRPEIEASGAKIKQFSLYRIIGLIVLLFVSVLVLFNSKTWFLGILLIIGTVVAHSIILGSQKKKAGALSARNAAPTNEALGYLGQPAGGLTDATGLCANVDALFLNSLDSTSMALEQQRRQMVRMQAQHEQSMAAQQAASAAQAQAMQSMQNELKKQNNALGVNSNRSFIGKVMDTRDELKS